MLNIWLYSLLLHTIGATEEHIQLILARLDDLSASKALVQNTASVSTKNISDQHGAFDKMPTSAKMPKHISVMHGIAFDHDRQSNSTRAYLPVLQCCAIFKPHIMLELRR